MPFARSRIKALRATGLKYASQQFEIDGCTVRVRIEPEHEYITLSGGEVWYSVFPHSMEHKDGVTQETINEKTVSVTPFARATPGNKTRLHVDSLACRFDWVSYDGTTRSGKVKYGNKLITFDGDTMGRYPVAFDGGFYTTWIDLQNIIINGKLAVFNRVVSGVALKSVTGSDGKKVDVVIYASAVNDGVSLTSTVDFYSVPLLDVFTTGHTDTKIGGTVDLPGRLRQPIFFDGSGEKFGAFFTTYFDAGITTSSIVTGAVSPDATTVSTSISAFTTSLPSTSNTAYFGPQNEYTFSYVTTSAGGSMALLGVDLTVDGTLSTLVHRSRGTGSYQSSQANFVAARYDVTKNYSEYLFDSRVIWSAYSGATYRYQDASGETSGSVETYTNTFQQSALYDVDIRHSAAGWIQVDYTDTTVVTDIGTSFNSTSTSAGSAVELKAVFGSDSRSKAVRPAGQTGVHQMLLDKNYVSKMIASRKDGNYMICICIPEAHHTGRMDYAAAFAGFDLSPLAFGRDSRGLRDANLSKFGLGANPAPENAVRYSPISLIYSGAAT